ncbi:MAG TPA: hypothetical protein VM096_16140 [Vicinamibacterales bacterium]|nr:hypothetical protein [Vicinamibacterales bacterium]
MHTKTAEQELIAATKNPSTAAEAHYWLGRIYDFKGNKAEGAFPGFHEEVSYRPRAEAEFKAAGTAKPEWVAEGIAADNALKAADAVIAKLQADPNAAASAIRAAIESRIKLRPDPMTYTAGANMLLARKAELPFVLRLAADGKTAGEQFIRENESSYKLDGKVIASLDRNAATFADIAGWALFLQGDTARAEARLAEAARLFRNVDATNQLHLAELSRKKNDLENAREHFLNALGLAGITPRQGEQAKIALADVQAKNGENPAEFEKWLTATLDRKREERRKALVGTMQGRKLPNLILKDLQGNTVDLRAERGNVVLLNFFSAW